MRLGNDIVDLAATRDHNPRFIDRILNPEEKSRRASWSLNDSLLWLYWASKEAAYKALRQSRDIPFHHREFTVAPDLRSIRWHDEVLQLCTREDGDALFAFATDHDPVHCHSAFAKFDTEPHPTLQSEKAQSLLLDLATTHLKLPRAELTIIKDQRIPKIQHQGRILPHAMSLTHHGRYVAASLAIP